MHLKSLRSKLDRSTQANILASVSTGGFILFVLLQPTVFWYYRYFLFFGSITEYLAVVLPLLFLFPLSLWLVLRTRNRMSLRIPLALSLLFVLSFVFTVPVTSTTHRFVDAGACEQFYPAEETEWFSLGYFLFGIGTHGVFGPPTQCF